MKKIIGRRLTVLLMSIWVSNSFAATPGQEQAVSIHLTNESLHNMSPKALSAHGQMLFDAKFTVLDGAGRPRATGAEVPVKTKRPSQQAFTRTSGPEANACKGCHNDPVSGGAGEFVTNVFSSEGVVNADFITLDKQFSNERGTSHLFGSGLVELLAREMTAELQDIREQAVKKAKLEKTEVRVVLETKGINFGFLTISSHGFIDINQIDGVDFDLVVRPFSQKGVFTSLRQFSINAMNSHHGMQASERYGEVWTHENDFDEDGYIDELTPADISSLVVFQAMLAAPEQELPKDKELKDAAVKGQQYFSEAGCTSCHVAELPLTSLSFAEPGPYNNAGTSRQTDGVYQLHFELPSQGLRKDKNGIWYVPLFSDLKRHVIADSQTPFLGNERLSQRFIANDVFITPRLWGVGSSAPYGHRGDISTLREIIGHHGGDAKDSRQAFEAFNEIQQASVIEFLLSLKL